MMALFNYDVLGHRVRKVDAIAGTTTLYYNDPEWRVLAEYDGTGTLQRTIVWGNYIDEALRLRAGESDYYYLHDHLYSPAVLIGYVYVNGQWQWLPVERYEFDSYGTARIMDPSFGTRTATQYGATTLFTGRTLDALDSGALKISYYRHRYTDPFTGRFLQQDPIGYVDGMNLYEYVGANPIRYYDPIGLKRKAHEEIDPKGRIKAINSCKCFCVNNMTIKSTKMDDITNPIHYYFGDKVTINVHGYWQTWDHKGTDGRASIHWFEWFSQYPTHNPGGAYDPETTPTHTWNHMDHVRAPQPYYGHYSFHDSPGFRTYPTMGRMDYEVYLLAVAASHPKCKCPKKFWSVGHGMHIIVRQETIGGPVTELNVGQKYPDPAFGSMPRNPEKSQIEQTLSSSFEVTFTID